MAIRIHVVVALGKRADELVEAFADIGAGAVGETAAGAWTTISALRASANAVDTALDALGGATLRATTVDGAYWELRLARPDTEPFEIEHHFSLLALGNLVLEAETLGELAASAGLSRWVEDPDEAIEQERVADLLGFQADAIADALEVFGFTFDRREVVHILSGVSTTQTELGWDTGNLARFMETLGFGEAVVGWREDLDEEDAYMAEQAAAIAAVEANPLAGMRARLDGTVTQTLDGGPVSLPLSELVLLTDLAKQAAGGFAAGFDLSADGNDAAFEAVQAGRSTAAHMGDRIEILADNWATLSKEVRAAAKDIAGARDGSALEIMTTILFGDVDPRANQRFSGRIEDDDFVIEATYPAMAAGTLREALQLVREGRAYGAVTLRDEDEGTDVIDNVADAIWFFNGPPEISIDGLSLTVDRRDAVEGIVQYLFIRRYGEIWDTAERAAWNREQAAKHSGS